MSGYNPIKSTAYDSRTQHLDFGEPGLGINWSPEPLAMGQQIEHIEGDQVEMAVGIGRIVGCSGEFEVSA